MDLDLLDTPGKRFKAGRLHSNLTQDEVAKQVGVTPQFISNFENGRIKKSSYYYELAQAVNLDILYLTTGETRYNLQNNSQKFENNIQTMIPIITWQEAGAEVKKSSDVKYDKHHHNVIKPVYASIKSFAIIVDGDALSSHFIRQGNILVFDPNIQPYVGCHLIIRPKSSASALLRKFVVDCGEYYLEHPKHKSIRLTQELYKSIFGVMVQIITDCDAKGRKSIGIDMFPLK